MKKRESVGIAAICDQYGVPARRGGKVRYTGDHSIGPQIGTIVGAHGPYLRIAINGITMNHHPTWELEYLEDSGGRN